MKELSQTNQPKPKKNKNPAAWDLVVKDIKARDSFGKRKYGTRLQPFNGRDTLQDLYEEMLDAIVYLRTLMYEREHAEKTVKFTYDKKGNVKKVDYGASR